MSLLTAQSAAGTRPHTGLVYTNPKRFNRAIFAYPENPINALRTFLDDRLIDR